MKLKILAWIVFIGGLWILALIEHLHGNPTAINALVGIPLGAIFMGLLLWTCKS